MESNDKKLQQFVGEDWYGVIKPAFDKYWTEISSKIKSETRPITPEPKDIFRAYGNSTVIETRVIILGMDPYPGLVNNKRVADGIAFSSINSDGRPPKSLKQFWNVWNDMYQEWPRTTDLSYLCEQGVLLLNAYLTTVIRQSGAHKDIWYDFTQECYRQFNDQLNGVLFVFMGVEAKKFMPFIDTNRHPVYCVEHPAAAEYKGGVWDHDDIFEKINDFYKSYHLTPIQWVK